MKVLFLGETLTFSVIPSVYPKQTDNLLLSLRNEMTDFVITPNITFTITDKLNITITLQPTDFVRMNKYEIELTNEGKVIYLGKLMIVDAGTNIQNYEYETQTNARFTY